MPNSFHQQQDVVIDRGDAGGDGDVEGNRGAVVLRHVGRDRIAAEAVTGLVESEVETVGVVVQGPCGTQARDASADDGDSPWHDPLTSGCLAGYSPEGSAEGVSSG